MSAACLISLDCSLSELMGLSPEEQKQLATQLSDIPANSLELFFQQAMWGKPVTGLLLTAPEAEQQPMAPGPGDGAPHHMPTALPLGAQTHAGQSSFPVTGQVAAGLGPGQNGASNHPSISEMANDFYLNAGQAMRSQTPAYQSMHRSHLVGQQSFHVEGFPGVNPQQSSTGYIARPPQTDSCYAARAAPTGNHYPEQAGHSSKGNPFSAFKFQPEQQSQQAEADSQQQQQPQQLPHGGQGQPRLHGYMSDTYEGSPTFEIEEVLDDYQGDYGSDQLYHRDNDGAMAGYKRHFQQQQQQQQQQQEEGNKHPQQQEQEQEQCIDWHTYLPEDDLDPQASGAEANLWDSEMPTHSRMPYQSTEGQHTGLANMQSGTSYQDGFDEDGVDTHSDVEYEIAGTMWFRL